MMRDLYGTLDPRLDANFKDFLEREAARARWAMDRPITSTRYIVKSRPVRFGITWDVFAVDYTRAGRDLHAGKPIFLATYPYPEQAQAFAEDCRRGKRIFYFRGGSLQFSKRKVIDELK